MIGVFDSGAGGVSAALELSRLAPFTDVAFLADEKNAPYGTKSKEQLLRLIKSNIHRLSVMGAEKILIACCTASTLWRELDEDERKMTLPIIDLAAESLSENAKRLAVIATEFTASSGAFGEAVRGIRPDVDVAEMPMQSLVWKIEMHRKGGGDENRLEELIAPELKDLDGLIKEHSADSLILGCTHFSWAEEIIGKRYPAIAIINPAKLGARRLAKQITRSHIKEREQGKIIYTR